MKVRGLAPRPPDTVFGFDLGTPAPDGKTICMLRVRLTQAGEGRDSLADFVRRLYSAGYLTGAKPDPRRLVGFGAALAPHRKER